MTFQELRDLLCLRPSKKLWRSIRDGFEHWSGEEDVSVALDYANEHMSTWPMDIRRVTQKEFKLTLPFPVWWPLVQVLPVGTSKRELPYFFEEHKDAFRQIKKLDLSHSSGLVELRRIQFFSGLEELILGYQHHVENLDGLQGLKKLRKLEINRCQSLQKLHVLPGLKSLQVLVLEECPILKDAALLKGLTKLRYLNLGSSEKLVSLGGLETLHSLEELYVSWCPVLKDISAMKELPRLKKLGLEGCKQLKPSLLGFHGSREEVSSIQSVLCKSDSR